MNRKTAVAAGFGLALGMGFTGCGGTSPSPIPPGPGGPGLEIIEVSIDAGCVGRIDATKTVDAKDRSVLVWRTHSQCGTAQDVLLCVVPSSAEPPLRCWGDPKEATLNAPFPIGGADVKYIVCGIDWPITGRFRYDVHLVTGMATQPPTLTCPTDRDYELALEVVP